MPPKYIKRHIEDALFTKKSNYGIWHWISYILGCILSIFLGWIIGLLFIKYGKFVIWEAVIKWWFSFSLLVGLVFMWITETLIERKVKKILNAEKMIQKLESRSLLTKQNINEILVTLQQVYIALSVVQYVSRFREKKIFRDYLNEIFSRIMSILSDLKNDLKNELSVWQEILVQVNTKINSTTLEVPEFKEILSLQSTRLDKQIVQFEELQKVLLKI